MNPRFITIHSTQNFSQGANALAHANLLKRGGLTSEHNSLGYLTWHFTVDQDCVYQHLPVDEQGQHADYNGNGNSPSASKCAKTPAVPGKRRSTAPSGWSPG